jgi:hypothetical protein
MPTIEDSSMDIHQTLIDNGIDWYVVIRNGMPSLEHQLNLSAVLQCGETPVNYGISAMQQCWGGEDLGEDAITVASTADAYTLQRDIEI